MERRFSKFTAILDDPKLLGEDYTTSLLKINENLELGWRNIHDKRFLDSVTEHAARQMLMTEQQLKKLQSPMYYLFEDRHISEAVLEFARKLSDPKNEPSKVVDSIGALPWDAPTLLDWSFEKYKHFSQFHNVYDWFSHLIVLKSKKANPDKPKKPPSLPPLAIEPANKPAPTTSDTSRDDFQK